MRSLLVLSLARLTFLSCSEKLKLESYLESMEELLSKSLSDISQIIGRKISRSVVYDPLSNMEEAKKELYLCNRFKIDWIHYNDSDYPEILKQQNNPPYILFYRGDKQILKYKNVSVVGTRNLTPNARKKTFQFSKSAALDGVNVVSGLAYGADSFAHKGAVSAFNETGEHSKCGKTIAVLPCSIDEISPRSNVKLVESIIMSGGLLISEYAPGIGMASWHFVQRNRIIAALSEVTVVTQAPAGSGALITAQFALEFGRDLMFLETCFDEQAVKVNEFVKHDLEVKFAKNKISRYKIENTVERYLEEGAPVIKDYEDYKHCFLEPPEYRLHKEKIIQPSLFEDL